MEIDKVVKMFQSQGYSKNDPDDIFDPIELEIGTEVEFEHTDEKEIAKEIAKDHLKENPFYYSDGLNEVEEEVMDIVKKIIKKHGYEDLGEYLKERKNARNSK